MSAHALGVRLGRLDDVLLGRYVETDERVLVLEQAVHVQRDGVVSFCHEYMVNI